MGEGDARESEAGAGLCAPVFGGEMLMTPEPLSRALVTKLGS